MQQTTNLDLELYEATDNANLLDGYNSSMRKIDARDGELSTLISGLNATVQLYDGRITTAQQTADGAAATAGAASAAATAADGRATTALANAAAALAGLGGAVIHKIGPSELGTEWTLADNAFYNVDFHAVIIEFPSDEIDSFMLGHVQAHLNGTIPATDPAYQDHSIINLANWKRGDNVSEPLFAPLSGPYPKAARDANMLLGLTRNGVLYWTHSDGFTAALTNPIIQSTFVFPVSLKA